MGGTLSETGDYLRLRTKSSINEYTLNLVNTDTELKLSKLGENAGILGACLIARNKILAVLLKYCTYFKPLIIKFVL